MAKVHPGAILTPHFRDFCRHVSDGLALYQVPMIYRGLPMSAAPGAAVALITTAEHSVLGTLWIYGWTPP